MGNNFRRLAAPLFTLAALTMSAALVPAAPAPAAEKSVHIGILSGGTHQIRSGLEDALIQGLRERGYVEGRNLVIERRYAGTNFSVQAPEYARELSGMRQYPEKTLGPRTSIIPMSPGGSKVPLKGSVTRTSMPGNGNPTVPARRSPL